MKPKTLEEEEAAARRGTDYEVGGKTLWEMAASHLMEREVFSFGENASCHDLAETMVRENFGSAPIVDREGRLVGIVSEYDLLNALLEGKNLKQTPAGECMTRPAISIAEEMTAEQVVLLLQARHLIRVPVTDRNGVLIGLVARRDILAGYLESNLAPLPVF